MIPISKDVREKLKTITNKGERYDDSINRLIDFWVILSNPYCRICIKEKCESCDKPFDEAKRKRMLELLDFF